LVILQFTSSPTPELPLRNPHEQSIW